MRTRSTDLTSSIAWSGWCPRARSSCSAVPTPPKTMSAPSARQAVITNSNCAGQNAGFSAQHTSSTAASVAPQAARTSPGRPLPSARADSAVAATWKKECGSWPRVGGTRTYCVRPSQKISVAIPIRIPGMPKATAGPYSRRKIGISSDAKKLPKLIDQ